ncbi:MAG: hypothetical protein FGM54_05995 [Chitinophagaceae bacterium]|nr:hypothetical protein [Chitinophagaceae bacterium]
MIAKNLNEAFQHASNGKDEIYFAYSTFRIAEKNQLTILFLKRQPKFFLQHRPAFRAKVALVPHATLSATIRAIHLRRLIVFFFLPQTDQR